MIDGSKTNLLRIIHYPPFEGNEDSNAYRAAAHEDINLVTLLIGGHQPGLEIYGQRFLDSFAQRVDKKIK